MDMLILGNRHDSKVLHVIADQLDRSAAFSTTGMNGDS